MSERSKASIPEGELKGDGSDEGDEGGSEPVDAAERERSVKRGTRMRPREPAAAANRKKKERASESRARSRRA